MSNGNNKHKIRPYHFPAPLLIKSDSPITVTDGKATLIHEGNLIVRVVDNFLIELQPQERTFEKHLQGIQSVLVDEPKTAELTIPVGYELLTRSKATRATYGDVISEYQYFKREKDASYFVAIKQGEVIIRHYDLGSLFDASSRISIALKAFSRERPFYRRDLKPRLMPPTLKQGQLIKSCLDVLSEEGFLSVQMVEIGNQKIERYTRTPKMLP